MENKKLYIVLSHSCSFIGKFINFFTHDKYSHVSIAFDKECNEMYSFSRKYRLFPFYGIFQKEDIRKGLFQKKGAIIAIYELDVTKEQYNNARKRVFEIKKTNTGYNLLGVILAEFRIKLNRKKYYCSEFVYDVLSNDNVKIINNKKFRFRPEELIENIKYKLIYEGKIREFVNTI